MKRFKTISEFDLIEGFPEPQHPLISLNLLTSASPLVRLE